MVEPPYWTMLDFFRARLGIVPLQVLAHDVDAGLKQVHREAPPFGDAQLARFSHDFILASFASVLLKTFFLVPNRFFSVVKRRRSDIIRRTWGSSRRGAMGILLPWLSSLSLLVQLVGQEETIGQRTHASLEDIAVISLTEVDQKTILRLPDGELVLLQQGEKLTLLHQQGERLEDPSVILAEVLNDRLLFEQQVPRHGSADDRKLLRFWLFKDDGAAGKSRVRLIDRDPPPRAPEREPKAKNRPNR